MTKCANCGHQISWISELFGETPRHVNQYTYRLRKKCECGCEDAKLTKKDLAFYKRLGGF